MILKKHAFQNFTNPFSALLLAGLFLFFLPKTGQTQVTMTFSIPSEMTVCGSGKQFQVTVVNNGTSQLALAKAQITLPTGIKYEASSVSGSGISEFSIGNLSSVTFSLPNIAAGSSYVFSFSARASYAALAGAQTGTLFRNTVNLTYTGGSKSGTTNTFNVLYPALSITNAPNSSVFVGQTFTRAVTIVNGGFGELSTFTLTDQFNSSLLTLVSVDKGTISSGGVITFSAAAFASVGDGDALFENNESLTVTETFTATGCSSTQSTLTAKWGCDATLAESNKKYPTTTIALYPPNLGFVATSSFNTCFASGGDEQSLKITNSGTGPAKSPGITIAAGATDLYTRVDISTITWQIGVSGTPTSLTPTATTNATAHACFAATSPKAGFTVLLPDVAPGQIVYLKWKTLTCATTACGSVNLIGWTYAASYSNMCNSQTYTANGTGQALKKKNFSMFVENPADLVNGQSGEYIFTLPTATFDMPQGTAPYFLAEFDLPVGLDWSGTNSDLAFKSGSTAWTPASVTYNSTTRRLTGKYNLPSPITLPYSEVRVKLTANCTGISGGLVGVGFALYYVMDGSCASPNKFSLTCYASPQTRLHCPGGTCVGMGFSSFSPKRVSKGAPDNNQDGIADASGSLDLTKIQLNRVMTKDTFETIFTGKIYTSATYPTWSFAFAKSLIPSGSNITALTATLSVFDASTGTTLATTINSPSTNSVSGGVRTVVWNLSPATVGGPFAGFVYGNDDVVTVTARYQLSGNIGTTMTQIAFTNEMYTATTAAGNTKFQCDTWSGNLTLVGYAFSNSGSENYNVESCTKIINQNYRLFIGQTAVAAGMDLFPFEYRNWGIVKDLQVTMPPGYSFVGSTMSQVRTVAGNSTATQTGLTIAPTSTAGQVLTYNLENYYASAGGTLLRSDDGFNGTVSVEIRPTCNVPTNVNQPMTWQYTFKKVPFLDGLTTSYYTSSADQVNYKPANFTFTSAAQTVEAITPVVSWDVDLKNSSNMAASNSWFYLKNPSGKITVTEVRYRSNNALIAPDANGFYRFGTTSANATKQIKVSATYSNCELDELQIFAGFSCDAYPTSLASFGCPAQQFNLFCDPQPAELQVRLLSYPPSAACDDYITVEVEMLASKLGAITDMEVRVAPQAGADISLKNGSTQFKYPSSGSYQSFSTPVLSNGYHAMLCENIVPSLATTGMPGVTNTAANLFKIKFNLELGENYRPGDQVDIVIFSKKTCGASNTASAFSFDPSANFERKTGIGLDGPLDAWSVSWVDYDNDGDPDIFIGTADANNPNALFRNNGNGTFTKITTGAIVTENSKSYASTWADIDNDGDMDGLIGTDLGQKKLLYKNNGGGTFTKINDGSLTQEAAGYIRGVSFCDYDNDGWVDVYLADYFKTKFNQLYHNNGDGTFSKVNQSEVAKEVGSSIAGIWGDYNNDGLSDLFVCNTNDENNSLYKNLGGGNFELVTTGPIATDGGKSLGASWGDIDNDGDLDLLVVNGGSQAPFLYRNLGNGTFSRIMSGDLPNEAGFGNGSSLVDYDNDGDLDALISRDQNQGNQLYTNDGTGFFRRVSSNIGLDFGLSTATAWADYDNDGDLDALIVNRNGGEMFFYKNLGGQCNSNLCLKLVGSHSNKSAIGAKIRVKATVYGQTVWQMRQISAQSGGGVGSQDDIRAIFGLGDATSVDSILVEWPSGLRQKMGGLAIDQCHTITELVASRVCGAVWLDLDGDCVRDAGEAAIPNSRIRVEPQNFYTATDADGNYEIYLAAGSYTVSALPGEGYAVECPSGNGQKHAISVNGSAESCGHDFGVSSSCATPDLEIEVVPTALRVGFQNLIAIHWRNRGTQDATDLSLSVNFGESIQLASATTPWETLEGTTYNWELSDLKLGESGTIYVTGMIPVNVPIAQNLEISANIVCDEPECNSENNAFLVAERTVGAVDPNDIAVSPTGFVRAGEELTYKIRFQNVGTFLAKNVVVENVLPEELDLSTLTIGAASHPFRLNVSGEGRRVTWVFENINLPDSVANEPLSHGFVTYKIRPKLNLPGGAGIANFADIFFDNLSPLRTNTVVNYVQNRSTAAFSDPNQLIIFPNPAKNFATVMLPDFDKGDLDKLEVFDLTGRLIWQKQNLYGNKTAVELPVNDWEQGTYFLKGYSYLGYLFAGKLIVFQ